MKAIILAAGRGSRMKEKTNILPKCLTEFQNKTLLEWQLNSLRNAGIKDIAVITGYRSEEIKKRQPELKYFHNENWEKTNMVATLFKAEEWLCADECIVSYSDIIYSAKAVNSLIECDADIAITYYTKFLELWKSRFENPLDDIETFKISAESELTEIGSKANSLSDIEGQYMGLLKFTPRGFDKISQELKSQNSQINIEKIDMTGMLSYLISKNFKIKAVPYDEVFLEIDNQNDLMLYESMKLEL